MLSGVFPRGRRVFHPYHGVHMFHIFLDIIKYVVKNRTRIIKLEQKNTDAITPTHNESNPNISTFSAMTLQSTRNSSDITKKPPKPRPKDHTQTHTHTHITKRFFNMTQGCLAPLQPPTSSSGSGGGSQNK